MPCRSFDLARAGVCGGTPKAYILRVADRPEDAAGEKGVNVRADTRRDDFDRLVKIELEEIPRVREQLIKLPDDPHLPRELWLLYEEADHLRKVTGRP